LNINNQEIATMTTMYFIPFFSLPIVIDKVGQYLTRSGEVVAVNEVSIKHNFGCKGEYSGNVQESWHMSGRLFSGRETKNDIINRI
jgi:hypothetical protein